MNFSNIKEALSFLQNCNFPIVIKADGLAAGKGVYISENYKEASKAVNEIFNGKFVSRKFTYWRIFEWRRNEFFYYFGWKSYKMFGTAQDHKSFWRW